MQLLTFFDWKSDDLEDQVSQELEQRWSRRLISFCLQDWQSWGCHGWDNIHLWPCDIDSDRAKRDNPYFQINNLINEVIQIILLVRYERS